MSPIWRRPEDIRIEAGRRRSRSMARIPTAGPMAKKANAQCHVKNALERRDESDGHERQQEPQTRLKREDRSHPAGRRELVDSRRELGRIGDDGEAPDEHERCQKPRIAAEKQSGDKRTGPAHGHGRGRDGRPPDAIGKLPGDETPRPPAAIKANPARAAHRSSRAEWRKDATRKTGTQVQAA